MYRVDQQWCPGENRMETPRTPSAGGLRIFWLNNWQFQPNVSKKMKKMFFWKFCLELHTSYLAKISGDPRRRVFGWSPDDFRRNIIAGPHGIYSSMTQLLTHTVANSTRPSFRPKTNNQSIKKFLSLGVSWVKVVKNCKILTFKVNFLCQKLSEHF